ncbi:MAG: hypothetical protein ACI845_000991 [Gammaproteobacteria bacterium]|jgi:hypothetical protein
MNAGIRPDGIVSYPNTPWSRRFCIALITTAGALKSMLGYAHGEQVFAIISDYDRMGFQDRKITPVNLVHKYSDSIEYVGAANLLNGY